MCHSDHAPQPNIPLLLGMTFTLYLVIQNALRGILIKKNQNWFILERAESSVKYPQVIPKNEPFFVIGFVGVKVTKGVDSTFNINLNSVLIRVNS